MNKKGFTLVEILVAITILGILTGVGIVSYTRVIQKSKEERYNSEKEMIKAAAENYLLSNKSFAPKDIGDSTIIKAETLKEDKYLTEDIVNNKGESCMKNSYVKAIKVTTTTYKYIGYVFCGDEKDTSTNSDKKPTIKVTYSKYNGVTDPYLNFTLQGAQNDDSITIIGYSYTLYVMKTGEDSFVEVYYSGTKSGEEKNIIDGKIRFNEFIDITGTNAVKVKFVVTNSLGERIEETSGTGNYGDDKKPICLNISNQAKDENDWINKKSEVRSRTITATCKDEDAGSGCVKSTFSKTWPNKEYPFGVEFSTITIKDNAKNSEKCNVRVNVDLLSPSADITVKTNGSTINTFTVGGVANGKEKETTLVINKNDYSISKGLDDNVWFNALYPNGVQYEIKVQDTIYLQKWTWKVNTPNIKYSDYRSNPSAVTDNLSTNASNDGASGTFTDKKNGSINIAFTKEGVRYGELKLYDKAGNVSTVKIYALLDRTLPTNSSIHLLKWNNNSSRPSSSSGLTTNYSAGTWSKLNVFTYPSSSTDNLGSIYYQYVTTGATTNENDKTATYRNIEANGVSDIAWRTCDSAYNCTSYFGNNIKVDKVLPKCDAVKTVVNSESGVDVSVTCTDEYSGVNKCNRDNVSKTNLKADPEKTYTYTVTDVAGNENTCSVTVKKQIQKKECTKHKKCVWDGYTSWTYSHSNDVGTGCSASVYYPDNYTKRECSGNGMMATYKYYKRKDKYREDDSCDCTNWGSWTNTSSCTAKSKVRQCRTLYK